MTNKEEIIKKVEDDICGSELREKIRKKIIEKYHEDPKDRFRIIKQSGNVFEVQVKWDVYDLDILSIVI